jgi:DNA-binding IclR family transcriptional regulator
MDKGDNREATRGLVQIVESLPAARHAATPGTQVVQRIALLLRLLTHHHRRGIRLVDLARLSGIERPTAHRLLQALIAERLVMQEHASKRYRLGPALYEMGLAAAPSTPLRDVCHPHLLSIAEHTGDTVFLTARSGFDGVCVDRVEGAYPVKVFVLEVGRRRPLQVGGGGVAILSALPDDDVARIAAANADTLAAHYPTHDDAELRRRLQQARRLGYVVKDVMEVDGVRTVAVPLRDARGQPVAGISVSTLASRLDEARSGEVAQLLRRAAAKIEAQLAAA